MNIAWYEHSTECKECYYYYYDSEVDDDYYLLPTAIATMTIKTGRLTTRTIRRARATSLIGLPSVLSRFPADIEVRMERNGQVRLERMERNGKVCEK